MALLAKKSEQMLFKQVLVHWPSWSAESRAKSCQTVGAKAVHNTVVGANEDGYHLTGVNQVIVTANMWISTR